MMFSPHIQESKIIGLLVCLLYCGVSNVFNQCIMWMRTSRRYVRVFQQEIYIGVIEFAANEYSVLIRNQASSTF